MFRIWLERALPSVYTSLLDGEAVIVGTAEDIPDEPLGSLDQAEAVIAGGRLDYDAPLMDRAPKLRVISRTGIGIEKIEIEEATKRGIVVCNAPDAPTISTAEHAIALMFAVSKKLRWCDLNIRAGGRSDFFNDYDGLELSGATLGLIGLGRIGGHVARIAHGIGMKVVGHDPFVSADRARAMGVELAPTLEEVLPLADVISLHVPLLPETHDLLDAQRFAQMKKGAILINTARGGLVDEVALIQALENGHLYGAGLDVLKVKPVPPNHPLLGRDEVVISPHVASATRTGKDRLWRSAINQALQVLRGQKPAHMVNAEVWPVGK